MAVGMDIALPFGPKTKSIFFRWRERYIHLLANFCIIGGSRNFAIYDV